MIVATNYIQLSSYFRENVGETVVFQWVEKIREILQTTKPPDAEKIEENKPAAVLSLDMALVCNISFSSLLIFVRLTLGQRLNDILLRIYWCSFMDFTQRT